MKKNVLKIVLILVITNILFVTLAVSAETNAVLLFDSKKIADGERLTVPLISPDGKRIVFSNLKRDKLWLADLDEKNNAKIIADADGCGLNIQWLGNNKILYLKQTADDYKRNTYSLFIYDIELGKSIQLTAATYDKNNPIIVDDLIFSAADLENQSSDKNRLTIEKIDEQIKKLLKGIFPFKKFDDNKIALEGNNISLQSKALKVDSAAKSKSAELPQYIYYTDNLKLLELNTKTLEKNLIDERVISFNVSPNNKQIIFNKDDDIILYNIPNKKKMKIDTGAFPVWIDNNQIIFIKTYDNGHDIVTSDIYLKNVNNSLAAANITDTLGELEYEPCYDFQSGRVYYSSLRDGNIKYFKLNIKK